MHQKTFYKSCIAEPTIGLLCPPYSVIPKLPYTYDSLFDSADSNTTGILKQLFGSKVEVVVNNDRKQVGRVLKLYLTLMQ